MVRARAYLCLYVCMYVRECVVNNTFIYYFLLKSIINGKKSVNEIIN